MNDIYGRPIYGSYGTNYQPQQSQMRTNKIYVMSLDDALNRYADPNTIMLYRQQDEKYEYEVTTDAYGKKTYAIYEIKPYSAPRDIKQEQTAIISKEEFDSVKGRLEVLEKEFSNKYNKKEKNGGIE